MKSPTFNPSLRSTSPPPSQKKSGDNLAILSDRMTCKKSMPWKRHCKTNTKNKQRVLSLESAPNALVLYQGLTDRTWSQLWSTSASPEYWLSFQWGWQHCAQSRWAHATPAPEQGALPMGTARVVWAGKEAREVWFVETKIWAVAWVKLILRAFLIDWASKQARQYEGRGGKIMQI